MTPDNRPADSPAAERIFPALLTLIGLLVRLPAALGSSFPLNDGGLFYRMILDLQANHFALPATTTYNSSGIPFAYPPLAFYLTGMLAQAFHLDVLVLLRLLPALISALCVPAFYFLARDILGRKQETVLAASLAFALTPRGFEWHIMGGGITRALGLLFALETMRAAHALFTRGGGRPMLAAILWGTLTFLTHPEAALQTALAAAIFYLALDRTRRGAVGALLTASAILLLSAPWWVTILTRFGGDPFLAGAAAARGGALVGYGGRLLLSVPAYTWAWSTFDDANP